MRLTLLILVVVFAANAQFPDTFLGSVSVGQNPSDVCFSPDGNRAYVAVKFGFVAVIDVSGYSEFALEELVSIDGEPVTLQCGPTGEYLYVADQEHNLLHIINTETLSVESTQAIMASPTDMVLYTSGNRIYMSHQSGMITVINTESRLVEDSFWAGEEIHSLSITPTENLVFAADNASPEEGSIDTGTEIIHHITSGMDSYSCAVSGDGSRLFLSCPSWNTLGVVDIASSTVEYSIACPAYSPDKMAALPFLPYLYGVSQDQNSVVVFGTDDLVQKGEISLPGGPVNIAVHPDGERLFVVCEGDNKIKIIGFDPSGVSQLSETPMLSAVVSPSVQPVVQITGGNSGHVSLKAFDLSGRTVWSNEAEITANETKQFTLSDIPPGILTVTARTGEAFSSVRVTVLEF